MDTSHFNGDSAESCSFDACSFEDEAVQSSALASVAWKQVLARTKLKASHRHIFRERLPDAGAVTHVRFNLFPDGGVSHLHICGRAERPADRLKGIELFNYLPKAKVRRAPLDCCGSKGWTEQMLAQMLFSNSAHWLEAADKTWIRLNPKDWHEAIHQYQPIAGRPGKTIACGSAIVRWRAVKRAAGSARDFGGPCRGGPSVPGDSWLCILGLCDGEIHRGSPGESAAAPVE